ncbi:Bifunctional lysine-specific demethylase and histidyl-hydroxylase NO66 [Senna tora]|uniref:Bifunctional lysine-specific demethylase and histidyl-hydroxylase n=1 Tax=Senna tora TaxID=362788 RepID=A0A834SMD3_9FABA|nr:Bifunctional lysine-specific demethylase and histidyl-hydroxylase NO66 [Senna tora]
MEEKHTNAIEAFGKRKRKSKSSSSRLQLQPHDADTIFPLLIASLSNSHTPNSLSLLKKCLSEIRSSLLSETHLTPVLALLPTLLNSKCAEIARRGADIVGAASLASFEMNNEIASDCETVKALISLLGNSKRRVLLSACNAVMDLCTTSFGKQQLVKLLALEKLMFVFLQIPKFSTSVSLWSEGNGSLHGLKIQIKENEVSVAFLSATIILINACDVEQLQKIPKSISEAFLTYLKDLWEKVSDQMAVKGGIKYKEDGHYFKSNIGVSNLAESIFRLSISSCPLTAALPFGVVKRSLFGTSESSFKDFLVHHWELSPFLLKRISKDQNMDDIFSPFIQSLSLTRNAPSLISSVLQGLVSCFPIASDEQNILNFLNEVKDKLGCPIVYQQDIRVVKTERQSRKEMHYFQHFDSCCNKELHYFNIDDVLKCEKAYKEGYTIALRGLEFRYQSIAAIADTLALMFGQPSVGANLYLTPPNSQGLACHIDDHCVFVCQIFGSKQWTVYSKPCQLLPRLYDDLHGSDINSTTAGTREFLLREGDVLYIPRGFPHEAYTKSGSDDCSSGFSLHLTLSVEVEPPFEWEGVAHFALHCWSENLKRPCNDGFTSWSQKLDLLSVNLLHFSIKIIGNSDPTFRKACLAAADSLPPDVCNWLAQNQKKIFAHVIDKIHTESRFMEVLSSLEIHKNEDPYQQIRWLWLLHLKKEAVGVYDLNQSYMIEDLLSLCLQHKDEVEAAFLDVKSRFCSEVVFEDVLITYRLLLQKYKKTRKQYSNGMISLHDKF